MTAIRQTLKSAADLVDAGLVMSERTAGIARVAERYAVAITPAMAALIDANDPADPIGRQLLPDPAELTQTPEERADGRKRQRRPDRHDGHRGRDQRPARAALDERDAVRPDDVDDERLRQQGLDENELLELVRTAQAGSGDLQDKWDWEINKLNMTMLKIPARELI